MLAEKPNTLTKYVGWYIRTPGTETLAFAAKPETLKEPVGCRTQPLQENLVKKTTPLKLYVGVEIQNPEGDAGCRAQKKHSNQHPKTI